MRAWQCCHVHHSWAVLESISNKGKLEITDKDEKRHLMRRLRCRSFERG
jgi:hypothetical protein